MTRALYFVAGLGVMALILLAQSVNLALARPERAAVPAAGPGPGRVFPH